MGKEIGFSNLVLDRLKKVGSSSRDEYRDRGEPGLFLFITRSGFKTFYFYRKHEGRPVRVKIGRYPDLSVSAARKRVRELKGQMALGLWSARERTQKQEKVTLRKITEDYLNAKGASLKARTISMYRLMSEDALHAWLDYSLSSITKEEVVRKHEEISSRKGKATADLAMRVLRAYFEFFIDRHDYTGVNPVKTLTRNRMWKTGARDRRKSIISNSDLPVWVRTVCGMPVLPKNYLMLLLFTGLRRKEASFLRWEDVDFRERVFTIRETKNGDELTLPMTEPLVRIFEECKGERGESAFVFPAVTDGRKPLSIENLASKVSEKSGVKFMLHDLRRTFITVAEGLDLSPYTIKRLVNHRSGTSDVTAGYMIFNIERLREPAERIAKKLVDIGEVSKMG